MEVAGEEEKSIGTGEATVIILAHGCIEGGTFVRVPACVKDFEKKNTTACGYYGMLDTAYMKEYGELLGDVDENGLQASFPQLEDIRAMRLKEDLKAREGRREGWQRSRFGDADMTGECSNGVCVTHSKRKVLNKIYENEKSLPLLFCYGRKHCANLFDPHHVLVMLGHMLEINTSPEAIEEIQEFRRDFKAYQYEYPGLIKRTTALIMDFVRLLKIKKLSILDFSCSAPCSHNIDDPATYIELPEDIGLGKTRKRKGKRNNNNKNKKKRKTRK